MALASAEEIGATITVPDDADAPPPHAWLFGEDQGRYLLTVPEAGPIMAAARAAGVPAATIGQTGGSSLNLSSGQTISLERLRDGYANWLARYMQSES
jgi:phosphoribosylformylglycinamidine synthase